MRDGGGSAELAGGGVPPDCRGTGAAACLPADLPSASGREAAGLLAHRRPGAGACLGGPTPPPTRGSTAVLRKLSFGPRAHTDGSLAAGWGGGAGRSEVAFSPRSAGHERDPEDVQGRTRRPDAAPSSPGASGKERAWTAGGGAWKATQPRRCPRGGYGASRARVQRGARSTRTVATCPCVSGRAKEGSRSSCQGCP